MSNEAFTDELTQFLSYANQNGYGSGNEGEKLPDGSKQIQLKNGPWTYTDEYWGGEPYGGFSLITLNRPIWLMTYYGQVHPGHDPEEVYVFLRQALLKEDKTNPQWFPIRGPFSFKKGNMSYWLSPEPMSAASSITRFAMVEQISKKGVVIYEAHFHGGLIDQPR